MENEEDRIRAFPACMRECLKTQGSIMKKYFWVAVGLCSLAMARGVNAQQASKTNLVQNGGFEAGSAHWKISNNAAQAVKTSSQGGSQSLYYKNTDPQRYTFFTQELDVKPGQVLDFSVWVKGKNVVGGGAGIFVQSTDTQGTHIAGTPYGGFPQALNGTFGWTQISGEYLVPDNEGSTQVGVYLRKGSTGEAWFDNVQVRRVAPVTFAFTLKYPNYHGMLLPRDSTPWRVDIEAKAHPKWKQAIRVSSSIIDTAGKVLLSQNDTISVRDQVSTITIKPPVHLTAGRYLLRQTLQSSDGQVSESQEYPICVVAVMPKVYIDAQGFTVVEGKRFFPLGAYTGPHGSGGGHNANAGDADLKRMADAGLNTVLSYGYASTPIKDGPAFLQLAQKNHMYVIYSVKDMYDGHGHYPINGLSGQEAAKAQIEQVKNSPALLAWYINDEMGGEWLKAIQSRYDQIWDIDGDHPAYIVSNKPQINGEYIHMSDVLGMDPYPVGYSRDLDFVTYWTKETTRATGSTKGTWSVVQIFNPVYAGHNDKNPTLDEMRNMSYQSLINGSKGLIYYAYHWLFFAQDKNGKRVYSQEAFNKRWPDVKKTVQEISGLTDVILHDDKINLQRVIPSTAQSEMQMIDGKLYLSLPLIAQYQAWQYQNKLYVMTVNKSEDKPQTLQLQIPAGYHLANNVSGIQSQIQDGILKLTLAPIASGTIILEK